jgi:hypothetical protein
MSASFARAVTFLVVFCGLLSSAFATSESSSGTRGGGDPDAVEAIQILENVGAYLERSFVLTDFAEKNRAAKKVDEFKSLMNDGSRTPITFSSETLRDESGAEKFALYNQEPPTIVINRKAWHAGDWLFKSQLLTLELFGIIGIRDRYAVSGKMDLDLLRKTFEIRATGWDFISISQTTGVVTIEQPYSELRDQPAHRRPFVILRNQHSSQMLNVLCSMFGFGAAFYADFGEVRTFELGHATLFDSQGSLKSIVEVVPNDSRYQVLRTLYCNR